ncbi:transcriptional regulator GcvA [Microbulbifer salipaludis]|uniref:Transcriptional regulator GcvA n=1 Tax=Microbulbifer salipaludis TaxID=187980 RepID=A0ABS3E7L6_9GAMM|nr:transcriptional regulator GcvA [Microbulbifer salipaludis]MBN8431292.1 transcriptional regulator GcvA [Microbulbifer salipaludis]
MAKKIPPLNALRSFEAAARHCSFRDAADELCVSHSAISHQVKLLERYLDLELFVRKARSVSLTKSGRQYYPVLREAFEKISEGTESLLAPKRPKVLTLQLYSTFAIRWMIPRLSDFQRTHPDVSVRLTMSQSDVDFDHEEVDACIRVGRSGGNNLDHLHLFSNQLFPVCSPRILAQHQLEKPEDLTQAPILQVYPSEADWSTWLEGNGVQGVQPAAGLQFDSYDHALSAALQGVGVALAMQPFVSRELSAGLLVEPFPAHRVDNPNHWYFVTRKDKAQQPKIQKFRDWLQSAIDRDRDIAD